MNILQPDRPQISCGGSKSQQHVVDQLACAWNRINLLQQDGWTAVIVRQRQETLAQIIKSYAEYALCVLRL